jgi:hypothetical protein
MKTFYLQLFVKNKKSIQILFFLIIIFVLISSVWFFVLKTLEIKQRCKNNIVSVLENEDAENELVIFRKECKGVNTFNISISQDTTENNLNRGIIFTAFYEEQNIDDLIHAKWLSPTIINIKFNSEMKIIRQSETKGRIKIIYEYSDN